VHQRIIDTGFRLSRDILRSYPSGIRKRDMPDTAVLVRGGWSRRRFDSQRWLP
jgi:hypothetical protein